MTSRRPDTSKVYTNDPYWRDMYDFTTFPQYFKQEGYTSVGLGITNNYYEYFSYKTRGGGRHRISICTSDVRSVYGFPSAV